MTDSLAYYFLMGLLVLIIAWLLLAPAPGHEPIIQFQHSGWIAP